MGKMRREERGVCTFSPTLCSLRLQSQTLPQLPNPDTHQRASEKQGSELGLENLEKEKREGKGGGEDVPISFEKTYASLSSWSVSEKTSSC